MSDALQLWEILVPAARRVPIAQAKGKGAADASGHVAVPCSVRYHRVWDAKVRAITGGLTILKPARGTWVDPVSKQLFADRTIPVRIACTRAQVDAIIRITIAYYNQLAVMAYRVSDEVLIVSA